MGLSHTLVIHTDVTALLLNRLFFESFTAAVMLCVSVLFDVSATFLHFILSLFLSLCSPYPCLIFPQRQRQLRRRTGAAASDTNTRSSCSHTRNITYVIYRLVCNWASIHVERETGFKVLNPARRLLLFNAALIVLALTLPGFSCVGLLSYHVWCRLKPTVMASFSFCYGQKCCVSSGLQV